MTNDDPSPEVARVAGEHLDALASLLRRVPRGGVAAIAVRLEEARASGCEVFVMGNGGSAATSLHMAQDLVRATEGRGPLRATSLNGNHAMFSGAANDLGYAQVFAFQLRHRLRPGDVVVGISASGRSPNCVEALRLARGLGNATISLLGFDGGDMLGLSDFHVHIPSCDYRLVEDAHLAVSHAVARCLAELGGPGDS